MDAWAYFRFTSLSVLLGCATFFFSYATWVWRRRQGKSAPTAHSSGLLHRVSRMALVLGLGLVAISYIVAKIVPIKGVMRLSESFAARARLDTGISHVAPVGPIRMGDVLLQFAPGNFQSELAVLKSKHEKLAAELDMTKAMPLEIDEELTRTYQNALSQIELAQATVNNLGPLLKETIRIGLEKHLDREDKLVAIDRYIIDYEATRNQSLSEYDFRLKDHERTATLLAKGALTDKEYQLSRHQAISSAEQIRKLEKSIKQFQTEIEQLNSNNGKFDQLIAQQAASLKSDVEAAQATMMAAQSELAKADAAIKQDYVRAQRQRAAETKMIAAEMQEIEASIGSLQEANTITAPRDGVVVYRSAAPNAVEEHGVVAVMAEKNSAEVQFTMPRRLAEQLDQAGMLDVWVEHSVFTSHLNGEITGITMSPYHTEYAIVSAVCQPPMDLIPLLASEELFPVQLTWHPPLLSVPLFQFAAGLLGLGALGCLLTLAFRSRKQPAEDGHAQRKAAASGLSEVPATEQQQLSLHQGSLGVTLQLLGNRLRESIFARTVDSDLVASIEWAIDRQQSRGIKLIRQGFVGHLTEDEDPAEELDRALLELMQNEQLDGTLHERLVGLLRTLQISTAVDSRLSASSHS